MCKICQDVLFIYKTHYNDEINGCCLVIADEIAKRINGTPTAGYLYMNGSHREHWWVTKCGVCHDPMGEEYKDELGFKRIYKHMDQEIFQYLLPQFEKYRII